MSCGFVVAVQMEEWMVLFCVREGNCSRQTRSLPLAYSLAQRTQDSVKSLNFTRVLSCVLPSFAYNYGFISKV